jgi:hypothetical protein
MTKPPRGLSASGITGGFFKHQTFLDKPTCYGSDSSGAETGYMYKGGTRDQPLCLDGIEKDGAVNAPDESAVAAQNWIHDIISLFIERTMYIIIRLFLELSIPSQEPSQGENHACFGILHSLYSLRSS